MKKLTKAQRNKYYKDALAYLKLNTGEGVCYILCFVSGDASWGRQGKILTEFPEFKKKMPDGKYEDGHWWDFKDDGFKKRVAALKACIKETNPSPLS